MHIQLHTCVHIYIHMYMYIMQHARTFWIYTRSMIIISVFNLLLLSVLLYMRVLLCLLPLLLSRPSQL